MFLLVEVPKRNVRGDEALMPRTRELKPAFFQDEDLATLSRDHRLLFQALWTLADREGRLEDRPAWIKLYSFPFDADVQPADIDRMLTDLAAHSGRFIERYHVNGKRYMLVKNFKKHQHIHPKEAPSEHPPIPEVSEPARELPGITGNSKSDPVIPPMPSEPSCTSKPSRLSAETPAASSPPVDPPVLTFPCDGEPKQWHLTQSQVDHWKELFPSRDILADCRAALAWVEAKPQRRKTHRGMPAFLVGWIGRTQDRGGRPEQRSFGGQQRPIDYPKLG